MSTAGKVLTVLVLLAILGWIYMLANITQLNKNWAQHIEKLETDIGGKPEERSLNTGGLKGQIAQMDKDLKELKRQTVVQQRKTADEVIDLKAQLSDVQKLQTEASETLLRLQLEVANVQASEKSAKEGNAVREKEKADTEKDLADTRSLVEVLKKDVGERFATLDQLRKEFKEVLAESQQRLEQLRQRNGNSGTPGRVRGASLIR